MCGKEKKLDEAALWCSILLSPGKDCLGEETLNSPSYLGEESLEPRSTWRRARVRLMHPSEDYGSKWVGPSPVIIGHHDPCQVPLAGTPVMSNASALKAGRTDTQAISGGV